MRGVWSTLALVAVALGLGAYIYFVDSTRTDTETKEKVFAVTADAVEELRVVSKGDTSVLKKANGAWALVEPLATDADTNEVTALVNTPARQATHEGHLLIFIDEGSSFTAHDALFLH